MQSKIQTSLFYFFPVCHLLLILLTVALHTNADAQEETPTPSLPAKFSFATGISYLNFQQNFPSGTNRNLSFESFDIPYVDLLLRLSVTETSFLRINFLTFTPSSTDSGNSTSVGRKTLGIGSLSLEYNYLPFITSSKKILKGTSLLGGLQLSALPVLNRTGTTSVDAEVFRYNFLRFGAANSFAFSERWSLVSSLIYSLPISSQSSYAISTPQMFEGDFVLNRHFNSGWDLGIGWNVKLHSYTLQSTELDVTTSQPFNAQQENLYSILYVQTGYNW